MILVFNEKKYFHWPLCLPDVSLHCHVQHSEIIVECCNLTIFNFILLVWICFASGCLSFLGVFFSFLSEDCVPESTF
jgi:hypothetical protein